MRSTLLVVGISLLTFSSLQAQSVLGEGRIERGIRIRVHDPSTGKPREGVLVEWRGDSALARIDASGEYVVVPPHLVAGLEIYDGQRSSSGKGAKIGAGIGLGASLLVVLASSADEYSTPSVREAVVFTVVNTVVYAGIGALIGSASKKPRWRRYEPGPKLQASLDARGRPGIALRIGF